MSLDHSPSSSYLLRLSRPFSRDDLALSPCHRAPRSHVTLIAFPVSPVLFSCSVARRCAVVRTGHFGIRDARRAVVCSVQFAAFFGRVFGVSHSSSSHEFDHQYSGRPPFAWFGTKHATQNNGPVSHFLVLVLCFYLISSERAFLFCYHTHHTHLGE